MPDRLPSEILLDILLLTLPTSNAYSTYRTRQDLLLSYSLVSRQVCRVAQPLLERVFRPKKALASILKKSPGLVRHVRVLQVQGKVPSFDSVFKTIGKMSNTLEARIQGYREDLLRKEMTALSGLHTLTLTAVRISTYQNLCFSNLVSLTLDSVVLNGRGDAQSFSKENLPNLRILWTAALDAQDRKWTLFDLPELHSQLDVLQVHLDQFPTFRSDICRRGVPVLLTVDMEGIVQLPSPDLDKFEYVQLNSVPPWPSNAPDYIVNSFCFLLVLISIVVEQRKGLLKSLVLPTQIHPEAITPLPVRVGPRRDELLQTCEECKVDVVWRVATTAEDDVGVSKEFWEYAKELRRKRREQGDVA